MAAELHEFKFPDEVKNEEKKEDLKIEIIDDTPPEDRGRAPLPKEITEELDKDDLTEYSDKVRQRMAQLKKAWHDERRSKETEAREKTEALRFAQTQYEEVKQLKQRLNTGEKIFISEVSAAAKQGLETARAKLETAYESGDAKQIAAASEALSDAKYKMREVEGFRPSLQESESGVQTSSQVQTPPAPRIDPKSEAWRSKNTWFGVDSEMTASALGLHEKLVKQGVDPSSDDYYRQIDATMRRRFPENFEDAPAPEPPRRASTVVAPASRSTAPRQVKLTTTQIALAKRLGITPEAYAREHLKLENTNG
jgi:hypothetical protein